MQRTDAAKWFWPFILVAAIAAATVIALPTSAPAGATAQPQFRMLVTVNPRPAATATITPVAIDPYCIEVKAERPPSALGRLAGPVSQHGQQG
ncbi:MAG: hypothetical protein ACM3OA_13275 [Acidobacteriota bacterium]|nr:hypothetical protein [Casimicrobiaceae bacterium]